VNSSRQAFNRFDRLVRRMRARRVLRLVPPGSRVLDVGCGQENWLVRNEPSFASGSLGIDPSLRDEAVDERGRRTMLDDLVDDVLESFDVVVSLAVIEHLDDDVAATMVGDFQRVLRPGGRLVLTTPSRRSRPVLEFLAFRLHVISADEIRDHRHYYSLTELHTLLSSAGFTLTVSATFQLGMNQIVCAVKAEKTTG
jgi:2-polyprenyl-3-methyl-5-hydroxy-6-metoxy-1,4-benzoquinol methylase